MYILLIWGCETSMRGMEYLSCNAKADKVEVVQGGEGKALGRP